MAVDVVLVLVLPSANPVRNEEDILHDEYKY